MAEDLDNDPDETEGRRLYRQAADALAQAQIAMARRRVIYCSDNAAALSGKEE